MQPFVQDVVHPTDFSPASERAFAHALAIALARKGNLTLLNAAADLEGGDWKHFPRVRETLERWGLLAPGSERADVFRKLSVSVRKVALARRNPVDAVLEYLAGHPADLLVLATEGREGLPRFLHGSVAQKLARAAGVRTLYVPAGAKGIVEPLDGTLALRRIVVPVAQTPDPSAATEIASRAAAALGDAPVEIFVLHVGEAMPAVELPPGPGWSWQLVTRRGDPVSEIVAAVEELQADLLVMATDGRDGFIDVFRGSHVERVVRQVKCPVLAIPIASES